MDIAVLLYGDHPDLAERCLSSIRWDPVMRLVDRVHLALNAVSPETRRVVETHARVFASIADVSILDAGAGNACKYPMLRRVLYGERPAGDKLMWFDDDSFVRADRAVDWLFNARRAVEYAHMAGAVYRIRPRGQQAKWVAKQPWFADKRVESHFRFITGGWWVARTAMFRAWNYPWPELRHRGGDHLLGEMMRQQGFEMKDYRDDVAINAGPTGEISTSKPRGASLSEVPLGAGPRVEQPPEVPIVQYDFDGRLRCP